MTNYKRMLGKMRELGMDYKWAISFIKEFEEDEIQFPDVPADQKKWAMERGFFPGRVELYSLTEDNYDWYLPDYHYAMMHPFNNHFLKWLDKTTLKYVLNSGGCEITMPEYYIYIENNHRYTYLMDFPEDLKKDENVLINLLRKKGTLALKPNSGTAGGKGFIKLDYNEKGGKILVNNAVASDSFLQELKTELGNYVVTEYVHQHHELNEIWPESECTLRVTMCRNSGEKYYSQSEWECVMSYARFGTSLGDGTSNLSSGGIGVSIDYNTGRFGDYGVRYKKCAVDGNCVVTEHPDTGCAFYIKGVPHWETVKSLINRICLHVDSLDYLGIDIIVTEDGMKLCEINSLPSMGYEQLICTPPLTRSEIKQFYVDKGLNNINGNAFYEAYMECQE